MKQRSCQFARVTIVAAAVGACGSEVPNVETSDSHLSTDGTSWVLEASAPQSQEAYEGTVLGGSSVVVGDNTFAYLNGSLQQLFAGGDNNPLGSGLGDFYGIEGSGNFHWDGTSLNRLDLGIDLINGEVARDTSGAFLIPARLSGDADGTRYLYRLTWDGVSTNASSLSRMMCNGTPINDAWTVWSGGGDTLVRDGVGGWLHLTDAGCEHLESDGGTWFMYIVGTSFSDLWGTEQGALKHFDGSAWTDVATMPAGSSYRTMSALVGFGPTDIWTGLSADAENAPSVGHWNGTTFEVIALPGAATSYGTRVWGTDRDHLWAITNRGEIFRFHP
jgi:hypothetical protein